MNRSVRILLDDDNEVDSTNWTTDMVVPVESINLHGTICDPSWENVPLKEIAANQLYEFPARLRKDIP